MKETQVPYTLLAKYFSGETTAEEKAILHDWRNECDKNNSLFLKLEEQWKNASPDLSLFVKPDKAKVWENIQLKLKEKAGQVGFYSKRLLIRIASIAAIFSLIVGFGFSYLLKPHTDNHAALLKNTIMAPSGQKTQLVLPDGTAVWLNSDSRLTYTFEYSNKERTVQLEGEAYFDVKQNEDLPFIVKAGPINVEVHGTAFNVRAYAEDDDISVSLVHGKVGLTRESDHEFLTFLSPNQSAIYSKKSLLYQVESCDAEVESSWHLNKLKFDGSTTEQIWKKLERWYGVKVRLQDVNPENRYWFSVKTESLTELLDMINKLTPIEYTLSGEEVNIRYK